MAFLLSRHWSISAILLYSIGLTGCSQNTPDDTTTYKPVRWSTGYTMPGLLTPTTSLNSIDDLPKLIDAPWYAKIDVIHTKVGEATLSSCKDYFDQAEPSTRTARDNEMSAYLELKVMCEATNTLLNAKNSEISYLPSDVLNDNSPKLWPKDMALIISTEESNRVTANQELTYWNDVTPIIRHESQSETKSIYYHESGYQEVEIVGYGDVNHDATEDIIIAVAYHVEGGSYFNLRLFVLSVDSQGNWQLIGSI